MNTRQGGKLGLMAIAGFAMAGGAIVGAAPAHAAPITYTETATASGSLGGVAFTNATITLTESSDTTNVTGGGGSFTNAGTLALQVNSETPVDFTGPTGAVDSQLVNRFNPAYAGFGYVGADNIIIDYNSAFETYALNTAIGPVTGSPFFNPFSFPTTGGAFKITSTGSTITFTATLGAAVPEPGSLALFASALAGLGLFLRRGRRRQA